MRRLIKRGLLIKNIITPILHLDLLTFCRCEKYERRFHYFFVSHQTDRMRNLNDLYLVLIAIWIATKNIICNKYILVDMGPADVIQEIVPPAPSPIQDPGWIDPPTNQDPEWQSGSSRAEDLQEPLPSPPEPQIHKKVLKGSKPAYKGEEYNKHYFSSIVYDIIPCNIFTISTLTSNRNRIQTMGGTNGKRIQMGSMGNSKTQEYNLANTKR